MRRVKPNASSQLTTHKRGMIYICVMWRGREAEQRPLDAWTLVAGLACLWGRRAGGREGCSGVRGPRGIRTSGSPYPSATSRAPPCSLAFLPSFSAPGPGMLNTSPTRPARRRLREYVRASLEVRGRAGRRPPVSVRQFSDNLGAILVGNTCHTIEYNLTRLEPRFGVQDRHCQICVRATKIGQNVCQISGNCNL